MGLEFGKKKSRTTNMKAKNLIVGAGLSGIVLAERLANSGEEVLIIDKRDHIGGNCYDYDENGILVHKYGSHIFHTNNEKVWKYLNQFTTFYPYMHKVLASIEGHFAPVPFNLNTLHQIFPQTIALELENILLNSYQYGTKISILELKQQEKLKFLADFIYEKIFLHYTLKQWQCDPKDLDNKVFDRVPIAISKDDRYFYNTYQGIPFDGYTAMCKNMLKSPLITIKLETDFNDIKSKITYQRLFYSGGIDEFFNFKFGELPYRSLSFDFKRLEKPYFQNNAVINYPNNYDFTRISEYKYFLDSKTNHTIISFEYPKTWKLGDERYYPVPNQHSNKIYNLYKKEVDKLINTYFIGRLGTYQYLDMDDTIETTLQLFDSLKLSN